MAHAMHWALYVLMFAQPLAGILMSQAAGYPASFFGLFELPVLLGKDPSLAQFSAVPTARCGSSWSWR